MCYNEIVMAEQVPKIIIHLGKPRKGEGEFQPKLTPKKVADELGRRGVFAGFSRGGDSWRRDDEIGLWLPGDTEQRVVSRGNVRAIRDHAGTLAMGTVRDENGRLTRDKQPTATAETLSEQNITTLNGPEVRQFDNKLYAADSGVFGDWMVETTHVPRDISDSDLEERIDGQRRFFKPAWGFGGKDIADSGINSIEYIGSMIREGGEKGLKGDYVMQPIIDSSMPFPPGITYLTDESKAIAEAGKDRQKEMRIFWFYGVGENGQPILKWIPTARFSKPERFKSGKLQHSDDYAYPDPDNIPGELVDATGDMCAKIVEHTGQHEIHGAFDFVYGSVDGADPCWRIGEPNMWQPVPAKHEDLNRQFVGYMADQLERMADAKPAA